MSPTPYNNAVGLAIETSGDRGEIVLGRGSVLIDQAVLQEPRSHARTYVAAVAEICERNGVRANDLAALFVSIGPGSFTGLRIGTTFARMLAYAVGRSTGRDPAVVAVPTMEAIAQNALTLDDPPLEVTVFVDAQRRQVFAATYQLDNEQTADGESSRIYRARSEVVEVEPGAFLAMLGPGCAVLGDGVRPHRDLVTSAGHRVLPDELFAPRAEIVYRIGRAMLARGETTPPRTLTPLYIRSPGAEEVWRAKHGVNA